MRRRHVTTLLVLMMVATLVASVPSAAWARTAQRGEARVPQQNECTSSVGPGIPPPASVPVGIPGFHASWYGQSGYPRLCPGDHSTATVAFHNSGHRGWVAGQMGEAAYLGTWNTSPGQDAASVLGGDGTHGSPSTGWPRYNRIAVQPASYVGPGQVAWFQFTIEAPARPGYYRLYLRPLVEGAAWMEDFGVYWLVTVLQPDGSLPAMDMSFDCSPRQRSAGDVAIAQLTDVSVGTHEGYDRVVFDFAPRAGFGTGVPGWQIESATPPLTTDPGGQPMTVEGNAHYAIALQGGTAMRPDGSSSYDGPRRFTPHFPQLQELAERGDFEAVSSWYAGVGSITCIRVLRIADPPRLAVDFAH